MPFVVGEGDPAWDNQPEDSDLVFKVSDFQYVESVFTLSRPPGPLTYSLDAPAAMAPLAGAKPAPAKRSLLDRLLGRSPDVVAQPAAEPVDFMKSFEHQQKQAEVDGRRFFAAITPAFRAAGIKAARCRYDGGNDEGFSYFEHYLSAAGEEVSPDVVAQRLAATDIGARLRALHPDRTAVPTGAELGEEIALEGAVMLNGTGYGNGPYLMYGAFTVDFDACTLTDDPQAAPNPDFYGVQA